MDEWEIRAFELDLEIDKRLRSRARNGQYTSYTVYLVECREELRDRSRTYRRPLNGRYT